MNDIDQRIAKLSPEKRQLLEQKLLAKRKNDESLTTYRRNATESPGSLSSSQLRLWFLDRFDPNNSVYNIPMLLKLTGILDVPRLERAISSIIERHESLRTTFHGEDDQPVQIVAPAEVVALEKLDNNAITVKQFACRSFDLKIGPLVRFGLLQVESQEHCLLVVVHHIISDGWSLNLFQSELVNLYAGNDQALPNLNAQYSDFAAWQKAREPLLEGQIDYWRTILDSSTAVLDLPVDRPRPKQRSYAGARFKTVIPAKLVDALQAFGKQRQATTFITLLTTLNILLARYSGKRDISVGSPVAGRNHTDFENVIGVFINTIVLRNDLSGEPSFAELLNRVREVTLGAFSHQEVPFEKLIERLQPERNIGHSPFFQVMLVLQNQALAPNKMGDIRIEREFVDMGTSLFELTLIVQPRTEGFHLTVEYSTEIFERQTISRLVGHWQTLMEAAINSPDTSIWTLPMLSEEERAVVLEASNSGAPYRVPDYPKSDKFRSKKRNLPGALASGNSDFCRSDTDTGPEFRCINDLFHMQAHRVPDAVALSLNGSSMSYRELAEHVNRLANHLRHLGVRPDDLVPILAERSFEMIIAQLGVLEAGGAYVPLDPAYPQERLAFALEDCSAEIVLIQESVRERLPQVSSRIVSLDGAGWTNESSNRPEPLVNSDNLAYVIYTSGSTGKPKGVLVTHANVSRLFSSTDHWFGFNETDVWTFFHSFAFDFSVWEIFGPLTTGGKLVIVPYEESRDPELFYSLIANENVTILNQTPSAFRQLMAIEELSQAVTKLDLRFIIFGGEALEPATLKPWIDRHGDEKPRLINMYGITETTVHVTYREITKRDIEGAANSLIGCPIPDLELYILDDQRQLVPFGVPGEMYVGGLGVAKGYLNRPELTAERFQPHIFGGPQDARLYRTGDLARRNSNGELEYLGRSDLQVKVRGYRIELGEIEAALIAMDLVKEAVVICREDVVGDQRLVAYVVVNSEQPGSEHELRETMNERLPAYMVPAHFVLMERLPLTQNGKVDRSVLPRPNDSYLEEGHAFVPPTTPAQKTLASIWRDVLGVERVGIRDTFFDRGGHSLLALRLVSQIEKVTGRRIALIDLFQGRTIEDITSGEEWTSQELPRAVAPIRTQGMLTPFFAIGSHPKYLDMAKRINVEQPVYRLDAYALQSSRLSENLGAYQNIEQITAEFTDYIQSIQSRGPYIIGGGCEGALLAFSIASELQQRGEDVAQLILWITPAPNSGGDKAAFGQSAPFRIMSQLKSLLRRARISDLNLRMLTEMIRHEYLEYRIFHAMDNYRPTRKYKGEIVLARTVEGRNPLDSDLTMGWEKHATNGVKVHEIPGNHETWLVNYAPEFGDLLESILKPVRIEQEMARSEDHAVT